MELITSWERKGRAEGLREGRAEGLREGSARGATSGSGTDTDAQVRGVAAAYRGRFLGKPLRSLSRFGLQDAQLPLLPL
jgi:hypothetical protein